MRTREKRKAIPIPGPNLTAEQRTMIFAEIEDHMFVSGLHNDAPLDRTIKKSKRERKLVQQWIGKVLKQWRESIDSEDLAARHYQLDRMAHHLYSEAMTGLSWGKAKESLDEVVRLINKGDNAGALALLETMRNSKVPDLRVAQRVLWNLCAVSGYGNKVTVDVSGAGITVQPGKE